MFKFFSLKPWWYLVTLTVPYLQSHPPLKCKIQKLHITNVLCEIGVPPFRLFVRPRPTPPPPHLAENSGYTSGPDAYNYFVDTHG
jgi:hypothetical protein